MNGGRMRGFMIPIVLVPALLLGGLSARAAPTTAAPSPNGSDLEPEGMGDAKLQLIKEEGAFKFQTEDWSGTPQPAAPEAPKIPASVAQAGTAAGEWTVNGDKAVLKYAFVQATRDSFDAKKTGYTLILSDVAWDPKDFHAADHVKDGTLHYIELTLGAGKQVYGSMLYHRALKDISYLSSAGSGVVLEAEPFGPDVIAGKVYMEAPEDGMGGRRYYAATFRAKVVKEK